MEEPVLLSRQDLDEMRQRTRDLRQTLLLTLHGEEHALKLLLDDVRIVLTGILEDLCHTHHGVVRLAEGLPRLTLFLKSLLKMSSQTTQVLIGLPPPFFWGASSRRSKES